MTASIGAPAGRYYHVICGGRALGTTPRSGLRVRSKGLRCRLETEDGAAMAFVLARVTP